VFSVFFSLYSGLRELHSFPRRRSSDLSPCSARSLRIFSCAWVLVMKSNRLRSSSLSADVSKRREADTLKSFSWRLPSVIRMASRSEEHTSELQSRENLVCRLLLEKKKV